ncbi:MAG TPA: cellulase family glycosylhydrolase [Thermomicrobiales bacterium]|nr:cellulase family glycosylhydrolase [Thermomicrobiales bacterium]
MTGRPIPIWAILHGLAILVLIGAMVVATLAETYYTRGIVTGRDYALLPDTDVNPMGVNTFLHEEPDDAVVVRTLDMIQAGGFGHIRQMFGWFEIEPQPGVFVYPDGQSSWAKFDRIVELAEERGIEIVARLEKPPAWARAGQPNPELDGPPDELADYAHFVEQVVSRYRGRITYVQLWNEPNLAGEWGGKPIDPAGYVELLQAGYEAAKRADPDVTVLLAGLAPTEQTGPHNLSDLLFLQGVYDAGGAAYFDIATVMVYGYGFSPADRRVSFERNNFSRPIQTREIMERNGDADTPIWAVEYGWVALPDDWTGNPSPWGAPVSAEQQADYLLDGYLRARREWPWMGAMVVWAFRFPLAPDHPNAVGDPTRGFALVEHDFTPSPAYAALAEAAPRIHAVHNGARSFTEEQRVALERGEPVQIAVAGDRLDLVMVGAGSATVTVEGREPVTIHSTGASRSPQEIVMAIDDLGDGIHAVEVRVAPAEAALVGYVVSRSPWQTWIFPWVYGTLAVLLIAALVAAGWRLWSVVAGRTGWPSPPGLLSQFSERGSRRNAG